MKVLAIVYALLYLVNWKLMNFFYSTLIKFVENFEKDFYLLPKTSLKILIQYKKWLDKQQPKIQKITDSL